MKITFAIILVLIGLTACSAGFRSENSEMEETSLLWKITGNDLKKPSYLFGTYHTISPQFLHNVPGFWEAFYSASVLILEIDPLEQPVSACFHRIMMPRDTSYKDLLDYNELYVLDSVILKYMDVSIDYMRLRPTFLSYLLVHEKIRRIEEQLTCDSLFFSVPQSEGLDSYLWDKANEKRMSIISLETHADRENIGFYEQFWPIGNLAMQAQELMYLIKYSTIDDLKFVVQLGLELKNAYFEQDLAKVEIVLDSLKDIAISIGFDWAAFNFILINERHDIWMEKLLLWFRNYANSSMFIAVGGAHLIGDYSIINLLRNEGFVVEPVLENLESNIEDNININ